MLDSIHKQGYYISSCSLIDIGGVLGVKIHQISSANFSGRARGLQRARLQSAALNQRIFMSEKIINIIVLNGFV